MTMDEILMKTVQLRADLHACAEVSGCEVRTRALLIDYLKANTTLRIEPCGAGFYAAHEEVDANRPSIALRADYDALPMPDGSAAHLCGHDGHAAGLCGLALMLEGAVLHRNVFLLFQPSEEIGEGAKYCTELFDKEQVDEIYGLHNLPGVPLGQVTTKHGTFACASRGLILKLGGQPTHAAYPEFGVNPAQAVGELLCALPGLADAAMYQGMTLCTVIGVQMGEKAFGSAAASAEVWLTLRGELDTDLDSLDARVKEKALALAESFGLNYACETVDAFPATLNDDACADKVLRLCGGESLPVPMRWSEDFGWYLQRVRGAFFGVGAGVDHPALHTKDYEFPDAVLPYAIDALWKLCCDA